MSDSRREDSRGHALLGPDREPSWNSGQLQLLTSGAKDCSPYLRDSESQGSPPPTLRASMTLPHPSAYGSCRTK